MTEGETPAPAAPVSMRDRAQDVPIGRHVTRGNGAGRVSVHEDG
jgi:hypothetical protein